MITAKEARQQVLDIIDCENELAEIEHCITTAIFSGRLETSTILSNTSDAKLKKLTGILQEKGYEVYYVPSYTGAYLFCVSW